MRDMFYEGGKDGLSFVLDDTTKGKLKTNPLDIIGKTVAWVKSSPIGTPTVGYGTADDAIAGIVTAIEEFDEQGLPYIVTVKWNETFDNIATATSATTAVEGKGVAVDGNGGVKTSTTAFNAFCISVHSDKSKCLIRVL